MLETKDNSRLVFVGTIGTKQIRRVTFDDFEECESCEITDICNFKCPALSYALTEELTRCKANECGNKG